MKLAPIKKVFRIIDSCQNLQQLKTCEKLADYYTELAKERGVINPSQIKKRLYIHINERKEELGLINKFKEYESEVHI